MELDPIIEARALDETESALREFVQASLNCGLKKGSIVLMLRAVANDLEPKIITPAPDTVQ